MSKESLINRKHIVLRMMIIVFIIILVLSILLAVTIGAVKIPLGDVYRIVLYNATHFKIGSIETGILIGDLDFASKGTMYEIVWNVRMPRVMMGAIVGVLLAMCGVVMQATVQNPLADPYILGISSGASLGATFSIMVGASAIFTGFLATMGTAFWAFLGALGAMALVMTLAHIGGGRITSAKLVLAGCVVGSLCGAFTNIIVYIGQDAENMKNVTYWLMGSLVSIQPEDVEFAIGPIVIGMIPLFLLRWRINLLTVGEEEALSMGIDTSKLRFVVIVCATLLTSISVAISGVIGWIGLVIPHFCRMIFGYDYRRLIPTNILFGATFLIIVDNVARMATTAEIPIGILTSFIGAPVFVYLILTGGAIRGD